MQGQDILFKSTSEEWATPQELFDALNVEFGFDLDVCATQDNAKCDIFFTKEEDGLSQPWSGVCWMNPPYGRDIYKWMQKAYESAVSGCDVVCLVPARTDTRWFHDFAMNATELWFVKGRVKFDGGGNSAPFPSVIVVFRHGALTHGQPAISGWY